MPRLPRSVRRSGFTLIELLVIIAIIAALLALSAAAVIRYMGTQQNNNTQTELDKVQGQTSRLWSSVKDSALKASMREIVPLKTPSGFPANPPGYPPPSAGMTVEQYIQANFAGSDANAQTRVRVMYVKLRLRQAFPMNFNEALNPFPLPPLPAYFTYLNSLGIIINPQKPPPVAPYESSACLLMALQRAQSGAGVDLADIGGGAVVRDFAVGSGTIPALVDAWRMPLFFTRAPAGSYKLNPAGAQVGANDPVDPNGLLNSGAWQPPPMRSAFLNLILQQTAPPNPPPMAGSKSFKLAPMIASAGPDKTLQVNPITFGQLQPGNFGDDLFSTP